MIGEYVVIGLGHFGQSVALNLAAQGQAVLGVDLSPERVQAISGDIEAAVCCDTTDEASLAELHLERASCVVVAIGADAKDASILTAGAPIGDVASTRVPMKRFSSSRSKSCASATPAAFWAFAPPFTGPPSSACLPVAARAPF